MRDLTTSAELDALLTAPAALLLKHGAHCPISAAARAELVAFCAQAPDADVGGLEVTEHRSLSDDVAARLGTTHASPQLFLLSAGRVRWSAAHRDIRTVDIAEQWRLATAGGTGGATAGAR